MLPRTLGRLFFLFQQKFEDILNNANVENAVNFLLKTRSLSIHTVKMHTGLFQGTQAAAGDLFQDPRVRAS